MRPLLLASCAVTLAWGAAAAAQPAASPSTDDSKCLLEMVALSNSTDPKMQQLGREGVFFFTGRITGREPNFNFASLQTMARGMNPQTAQTDLQQRCGPMFQKYIQQLQAALQPPAGAQPPAAGAKPKR